MSWDDFPAYTWCPYCLRSEPTGARTTDADAQSWLGLLTRRRNRV